MNEKNINQRNSEGETKLIIAAPKGNIDEIKKLLEAGADPCIKDNNGMTARTRAKNRKLEEVAELLRIAEEKSNCSKQWGNTINKTNLLGDELDIKHKKSLTETDSQHTQKNKKQTVNEYAVIHGLSIELIMAEIADGKRNAYNENGQWYIGNKSDFGVDKEIAERVYEKASKPAEQEKSSGVDTIAGIFSILIIFFVLLFSFLILRSCLTTSSDKVLNESIENDYSSTSMHPSARSEDSGSSSAKINSLEEVNCIFRLVTERASGKNQMTDEQIAALCDKLF